MNLKVALKKSKEDILGLSLEERIKLANEINEYRNNLKQKQQLLLYEPVNKDARRIHLSMAKEIIVTGGNRSSKTDTTLAEMCIQGTGIIPYSLEKDYPRDKKFKPPLRIRVVCKSLTNVLEPIIKPKLQWWKWNGRDPEGGSYGHWGWIPPHMLKNGDWFQSWSEKQRTLSLANGTTIQFMSHDQETENFSGGSFHLILHDEGPPKSIYRENKMRTIDTGGKLYMAMTPPDDEGAAWDAAWVYDELYEKGLEGPNKDENIDSFTLFTEHNRILSQQEIHDVAKSLSDDQKEVRFHGKFLHLTGRIYPLYTDVPKYWCFGCNKAILSVSDRKCSYCQSEDTASFCHFVEPIDQAYTWPVVMVLDPHPRKPHCIAWYAISPSDDVFQVAELRIDDEPLLVYNAVRQIEGDLHLQVHKRLIDPNMGQSPSSSSKTSARTVKEEFDLVGLRCSLANDNRLTARMRLKELMKPDKRTMLPRFRIFNNCKFTNNQFLRYCWAEWTRYSNDERDPKPRPRDKDDDFPTLAGYLVNGDFTFRALKTGTQILRKSDVVNSPLYSDKLERIRRGTFYKPLERNTNRPPSWQR